MSIDDPLGTKPSGWIRYYRASEIRNNYGTLVGVIAGAACSTGASAATPGLVEWATTHGLRILVRFFGSLAFIFGSGVACGVLGAVLAREEGYMVVHTVWVSYKGKVMDHYAYKQPLYGSGSVVGFHFDRDSLFIYKAGRNIDAAKKCAATILGHDPSRGYAMSINCGGYAPPEHYP